MPELGTEQSMEEILAKVQRELAAEAKQGSEAPADAPRSAEVVTLNRGGDARARSDDENAVGNADGKEAITALTQLAAIYGERRRSSELPVGGTGRTLEDVVREMLQPMLQSWLDEKLPGIIERLARAELARVIGEADLQ
jgi:cell pole-organizing protein PopZ